MDILWIMQTRVWRVLVSDLFSLLLVGIGLPTMVLLSTKGHRLRYKSSRSWWLSKPTHARPWHL
jgi:hypothetical protein